MKFMRERKRRSVKLCDNKDERKLINKQSNGWWSAILLMNRFELLPYLKCKHLVVSTEDLKYTTTYVQQCTI